MTRQPYPTNSNYEQVVRGLLHMHRLTVANQDETPEADEIRDAMAGPWELLSKIEQERVRGLSIDLFSVSGGAGTGAREQMNPQAQARLNDAYEARQRGEWDRTFELLRRVGKYGDPALLSYLRASTWLEAGDPAVAAVFFEHAWRLDPDNGKYRAMNLHALAKADPADAIIQARKILESGEDVPPIVAARSAEIIGSSLSRLLVTEAGPTYRQLITMLERALSWFDRNKDAGEPTEYAMITSLLGAFQGYLGDDSAALNYYTLGLSVDPNNDALLTARGMLLYGKSPRAIDDFKLAIQAGTTIVWPFYFVAHHYLLTSQFEECRQMCERALGMSASNSMHSELAEWLGISQAELSYPDEIVRASFERAARLDASNDRARRNLAILEDMKRESGPQTRPWEKRSAAAVRTFGQAERQLAA